MFQDLISCNFVALENFFEKCKCWTMFTISDHLISQYFIFGFFAKIWATWCVIQFSYLIIVFLVLNFLMFVFFLRRKVVFWCQLSSFNVCWTCVQWLNQNWSSFVTIFSILNKLKQDCWTMFSILCWPLISFNDIKLTDWTLITLYWSRSPCFPFEKIIY